MSPELSTLLKSNLLSDQLAKLLKSVLTFVEILNPNAKLSSPLEKLGSKKAEKTGTKPAAVFTETLKHD
ncbi:ATV_collapsed_G0008700.mRNA.1.CDS.1 [Saccharomyces cerevisiae]|nr:ATV_collapsed_G0008700.mRNA.1.CDS.1 [Saccharomyces cerevisiae]